MKKSQVFPIVGGSDIPHRDHCCVTRFTPIPRRSRTSVCTGCICNYNWTQFSNPLVTLQRASRGSVSEQSAKEHEVAAKRSVR